MKNIDNWVFHYNSIRGLWCCAKRENYRDLFNDNDSDSVLRSSDIDTLVRIINQTDGKHEEIEKMLN